MRSRYADKFNHDPDATGYDRNVQNERDPIRAGYSQLLDWIAEQVDALSSPRVLDLGSGTGNLGMRLRDDAALICVDVSTAMTKIARAKLAARREVSFVTADLLEFFETNSMLFDAVVSSYAIHHLTEDEKTLLFEHIARSLRPGGIAALGDLMFENAESRTAMLQTYRTTGRGELAEDIEDEFFWTLDSALHKFRSLGFDAEARRFSELSWAIVARDSGAEGGVTKM
jgi:putative AdoMet-dependent methyltransferase